MAFENLVPNAINTTLAGGTANVDVGTPATVIDAIDNLTDITTTSDPDGNYVDATGGGQTSIRVSFPTPTAGTGDLVGIQTAYVLFRRQNVNGNGTGNQTVTALLQVYNGAASETPLTTSGTSSVSNSNNLDSIINITFNASTLGITDGSAIEFQVSQTVGGTGGNPNNRSYVEVGEVLWSAQLEDPRINDPYNYAEII
jgi:hypothetical protein